MTHGLVALNGSPASSAEGQACGEEGADVCLAAGVKLTSMKQQAADLFRNVGVCAGITERQEPDIGARLVDDGSKKLRQTKRSQDCFQRPAKMNMNTPPSKTISPTKERETSSTMTMKERSRIFVILILSLFFIGIALALGYQDWLVFRNNQVRLAWETIEKASFLLERERWRLEHQGQLFVKNNPNFIDDVVLSHQQSQHIKRISKNLEEWFPGFKSFSIFPLEDCDISLPEILVGRCPTLRPGASYLMLERLGSPLIILMTSKNRNGENWGILVSREFTPIHYILSSLSVGGVRLSLVKHQEIERIHDAIARTEIFDFDWVLVAKRDDLSWNEYKSYLIERVGFLIFLVLIGTPALIYFDLRIQRNEAALYALESVHAQLYEQATHDTLTGLHNRHAFNEHLQRLFAQSRRLNASLAVVLIDIDYFKQVNDCWGHEAGDNVLQRVAAILRERVRRPMDMVARLGGEEFVLIYENVEKEDAWSLAELTRLVVADHKMPHPTQDHVSISVGVAVSGPNDSLSPKELLNLADHALYAAKRAGRNRVIGAWELVA